MIAIVDYGMGNVRSAQKAFAHLGYEAIITSDPKEVEKADKIVLPGDGAFGASVENLEKLGLKTLVLEAARGGKPFLGICVGMQILFSVGEEMGYYEGLGLFKGRVVRFFPKEDYRPEWDGLKVPHMGWNVVRQKSDCPLWKGVPDEAMVYFVHSYYPLPEEGSAVASTTDHGIEFCSSIWRDNIMATQFHPEKSGAAGLRMLTNFGAL
ncbi:MAG: imidazole glycerol phosphate synthase subunit HisH [Armatimonadetes bacterium]|nr:imidazole glycerol phosphate synthase subunit HisH [Armatimonadota bacterium]